MALYYAPVTLQQTLEQKGERVFKRKDDVLFRRGEEAFGMFVVLSGKVSLDFGVDSRLSRSYGAGVPYRSARHTNAEKLPDDSRRHRGCRAELLELFCVEFAVAKAPRLLPAIADHSRRKDGGEPGYCTVTSVWRQAGALRILRCLSLVNPLEQQPRGKAA